MVEIEFKEYHFMMAVRAFQRIIAKRMQDGLLPTIKTAEFLVLFFWYDVIQLTIDLTMSGIQTAIPDHLKMLFRDVADEAFYEIHDR